MGSSFTIINDTADVIFVREGPQWDILWWVLGGILSAVAAVAGVLGSVFTGGASAWAAVGGIATFVTAILAEVESELSEAELAELEALRRDLTAELEGWTRLNPGQSFTVWHSLSLARKCEAIHSEDGFATSNTCWTAWCDNCNYDYHISNHLSGRRRIEDRLGYEMRRLELTAAQKASFEKNAPGFMNLTLTGCPEESFTWMDTASDDAGTQLINYMETAHVMASDEEMAAHELNCVPNEVEACRECVPCTQCLVDNTAAGCAECALCQGCASQLPCLFVDYGCATEVEAMSFVECLDCLACSDRYPQDEAMGTQCGRCSPEKMAQCDNSIVFEPLYTCADMFASMDMPSTLTSSGSETDIASTSESGTSSSGDSVTNTWSIGDIGGYTGSPINVNIGDIGGSTDGASSPVNSELLIAGQVATMLGVFGVILYCIYSWGTRRALGRQHAEPVVKMPPCPGVPHPARHSREASHEAI